MIIDSPVVSGSLAASFRNVAITGSLGVTGSITTTGTITAQTLIVQMVTTSFDYITGSSINGSLISNTHQFTGSILVTGSIGIGTAPSYPIDIFSNNSSSLNILAQYYNSNSGSGVRNFIRVRNNISLGSTYSSYFGQGQDGKLYIISNDPTRNDIVIDGTTGYVGIATNSPVVPLHVSASGGVLRAGAASNEVRIGNDGGGTYLEQYGTTSATSVLRLQSSKSGNAADYTTLTIDPYSGLNVTKSGTGGNNVFASGVPIQVIYGAATVTSGGQGTGTGYSLGTACNSGTPTSTQGIEIASVSFTPKKANSLILIQTNSVVMWERTNISDHFYLWAANSTDATVLVKAGQYLTNFGPGNQNGGIVCLNGIASSWGTSTKTISFRIGSTGGGASYEWNPYYDAFGSGGSATVGNFTYVITEIGQ